MPAAYEQLLREANLAQNALVALRAFPLTSNGKIDLRALPIPGLDHQLLRYSKEKK